MCLIGPQDLDKEGPNEWTGNDKLRLIGPKKNNYVI